MNALKQVIIVKFHNMMLTIVKKPTLSHILSMQTAINTNHSQWH